MPSLTSELFVRLLDGVTKPAAAVSRGLLGIGKAQDSVNRSLGQRMADASARNAQQLDAVRGSMVDAAAAGYLLARGLAAPTNAAIDFETQLEDIGQKADIPQEKLSELGKRIKQIGKDTNQASTEIAKSIDTLVGMGASEDVALAAAAPIGQAATAYRAATDDLAAASYAAVENLKVPAGEIPKALDAMAEAGKRGAFELRDMAKYFPSLGAAYQGLGQTGTSSVADLAAALQVVRKGTGDASSAATNLQNVLQKIYAPGTVKKFKEEGVDIFKAMAKAAKQGKTPIEAIAEITEKTLKGDLSKMGTLFEDAQVQAGLRALIQNMGEYRKIREEANKAQGVVAADYERRMNNASQSTARFRQMITNLNIAIGSALLPALNDLVSTVTPAILALTNFAEANPELTRNVVAAATALIGFRVATLGVRWAALFMRGGLLSVIGPVVRMGEAAATAAKSSIALQTALAAGGRYTGLQKLGTAIKAIAFAVPGFSAVAGAIGTVGAALTGPVVAAIAAVASAGLLIWKYWDRISSVFAGVGRALGETMAPAFQAAKPYLEWLAPLGQAIADGWNKAKEVLSAFGTWIGSFFQQEVLNDQQKAQWEQAGYQAATRMIEAIKSVFSGLVDWAADIGSRIGAAIANGATSAINRVKGWFGGGGGAPAAANSNVPEARAKGGTVKKGKNYVVGDGGEPEFFSPGASGFITPFSKAKAIGSEGSGKSGKGGMPPMTYAPQFNFGNVYGVEDFEAKIREAEARMKRDFDAMVAGNFSDAGAA